MKVLLGILIGIAIVRAVRYARWRHGHGHGFGHGFGPFRRHGGCGHRGRMGHRLMWALRELELDPRQQDELKEVWLGLRRTIGEVQFARWRAMSDLVELATAEPLDRPGLDALAARHGEDQGRAAREIAEAVARAHDSLRPEQRARLRELAERSGLWRFPRRAGAGTPPPGDGPYR